jgi:hypothetical protein
MEGCDWDRLSESGEFKLKSWHRQRAGTGWLTRFGRQDQESDAGRKTTAMLVLGHGRHSKLDKVNDTNSPALAIHVCSPS